MRKARLITLLLIPLAVLVAVGLLPVVRSRLLAASVTLNLLVPEGRWRPLEVWTRAPERSRRSVESSSGRTLTVDLYTPKDSRAFHPALIVYTPFIGGGLDDSRLINLASTFARAGFVVAVPWREGEAQIVSTRDVDDIVATAQLVEGTSGSVGLFGMSYGTGPVFAAAADDRISDEVDFIISLNGYFDLKNVIDFIQTGSFAYKELAGQIEPHSYPQEILTANLAELNISLEQYQRSDQFTALREELSPASFVPVINAQLFIIHSTADTFIPYTESLRLHEAARAAGMRSSLVLTDVIEHGSYRPLTVQAVRRYYLPAGQQIYALILSLLSISRF